METEIKELIQDYCRNGRKPDQTELIALLREAQEICGGILKDEAMEQICRELDLKYSYLKTVIRYLPDIKTECVAHHLNICDGKNCRSNNNARLQAHMENKYHVKPGGVSQAGKFSYRLCGCMKRCKEGPNIKWDGEIYTGMTPEKLDKLIGIR